MPVFQPALREDAAFLKISVDIIGLCFMISLASCEKPMQKFRRDWAASAPIASPDQHALRRKPLAGLAFFFGDSRMGKRFTATEKWEKEWFRKLPIKAKCLWLFLCDKADPAGVWEPDFELASFLLGVEVTVDTMAQFGDRMRILPSGKWQIVGFIQFQYGTLSAACKGHVHVLTSLSKHGLGPKGDILSSSGLHTLCNRVSDRDKEEDKDKDMDKDKEKDKEKEGELRGGLPNCYESGELAPGHPAGDATETTLAVEADMLAREFRQRSTAGSLQKAREAMTVYLRQGKTSAEIRAAMANVQQGTWPEDIFPRAKPPGRDMAAEAAVIRKQRDAERASWGLK